jgi:hypothetical protein
MAVVLTTQTPKLRYQPFTGLSELDRAKSGIPRAEAVYAEAGTWAAPGAGNNRAITFSQQLDRDYGYIITDIFVRFYDNGELSMEAVGEVEIQTTPGHPNNEIIVTQMVSNPSRMDDIGSTAIGSVPANEYNSLRFLDAAATASMNFRLAEPKPTMLIYPFADSAYPPTISVRFAEHVANQDNYFFYYYLRLLEYDISQSYNYVIHTPQLTR